MEFKELSRPPIKEAIINVSFKDTFDIRQLEAFCSHPYIKNNYPFKKNLMAVELKNNTANNTHITTSHKHEGFILGCGNDCDKSIHSKIGQLSFHNTKKYIGWDKFYNEFKEIWKIYCETTGKMDLTQVSVRYINEIVVSFPLTNGFQEYVNFVPTIPAGISTNVNNFFLQLNVPDEKGIMNGIITETFRVTQNDKIVIILDLNVIKAGNLQCNSDEMWTSFLEIRNFKNHLFFSCLTNKTIEMYE